MCVVLSLKMAPFDWCRIVYCVLIGPRLRYRYVTGRQNYGTEAGAPLPVFTDEEFNDDDVRASKKLEIYEIQFLASFILRKNCFN